MIRKSLRLRSSSRSRRQTFRPAIQALEQRLVLSTFTAGTSLTVNYTAGVTFEAWVKTTDLTEGFLMGDGGGASAESGMSHFLSAGGTLTLYGNHGIPGATNFSLIHESE